MKLQRSAVACGCTLAAAAMCLDISQLELIEIIGHDGQAIWFPNREGCAQKRGFHVQEIIDAAFALGWAVVPFEARPTIRNGDEPIRPLWPDLRFVDDRMKRLFGAIKCGMVIGRGLNRPLPHAIAWDGSRFFDPNGGIYVEAPIFPECLFAFLKT